MAKYIPTVHSGQTSQGSRFENEATSGMYIKVAKIVRVDYEAMICDVVYLDSTGAAPQLDITSAYGGTRTYLGAMPMENDWVLIGMQKSGNYLHPYIIQFLHRGQESSLAHDIMSVPQAFIDIGAATPVRYKIHKLYPGEIYAASTYGSEFLLDKDITISNSKLNEIMLKSADQSFNVSSLNTNINNCGVRIKSGLIYRNYLITDPAYNTSGTSEFPIFYNEEGAPQYVPTYSEPINDDNPYGTLTLDDDAQGFIEHRIEVAELGDPILPVTEANSGVEIDDLYDEKPDGTTDKPLVVQVLGTLVGNDPVGEAQNYGRILKPKLFANQTDQRGFMSEEACIIEDGIDETTTLAAAYTLKFPTSGTAFYVNKQGKFFANVVASTTTDAVGGGESAEINFAGASKVFLGANTLGRSLSMTTDGELLTNFGGSTDGNSRSWDATFRKGVYFNITGADKDNLSFRMDTTGDVRHTILGSKFEEVKGDFITLVHGTMEDRVLGKKIDNYINDKATTYGGNFNEMTMGSYNQIIASGRSVTIYGPDTLSGSTVADSTEVILGDVEHTMKLGNKTETLLVGDHNINLTAGDKNITITAGNYSISITAGDISISTNVGDISLDTSAGNVEITGSLGVTIKSAVSVTLDAPQVQVGGSVVQGGIVNSGPAGFKCVFSGVPHLGSATCNVNTI